MSPPPMAPKDERERVPPPTAAAPGLFALLRAAGRLDVFDLNYSLCSERFDLLSFYPIRYLPPPGYGRALVRILRGIAKSVWHAARRTAPLTEGGVALLTANENNRTALEFVQEGLPSAYWVGTPHGRDPHPGYLLAVLLALPFLPSLIRRLRASSDYVRRSARHHADLLFLAPGYYVASALWLRRHRPVAVFIANDHLMTTRAFNQAARDLGIPTFYVQHACVTTRFPPLAFTYALLDGRDALQKYEEAGPSDTIVYLTGLPKAAEHLGHANTQTQVRRVGICINELDPVGAVIDLCKAIRRAFPDMEMTLRPHPASIAVLDELLPALGGIDLRISNPLTESPFAYLARVDALLAGDSSIHLEAALVNVYPIYYPLSGAMADIYGFVARGLVEVAPSLAAAIDFLRRLAVEKPPVRHRARYYDESLDTPHEGQASGLARRLIHSLLAGRPGDETWERIPSGRLTAYGLRSANRVAPSPPPDVLLPPFSPHHPERP